MWFGTLDGLNRYDGYKMKVFKHALTDPTSLSDNKIRTLYEDRAGSPLDRHLERWPQSLRTGVRDLHPLPT